MRTLKRFLHIFRPEKPEARSPQLPPVQPINWRLVVHAGSFGNHVNRNRLECR